MRKNVAVILAAGRGTRLGLDIPKQFLKIAGKTVLEHAVEVFQRNTSIHEIAIVVHPSYTGTVKDLVLTNGWDKVKAILNGGEHRHESSLAALRAYAHDSSVNLIFHDAVRPLVSQRIVNDVIAALQDYDAVDTAIPAVDTIIMVQGNERTISSVPERRYVWRGQTPQAFKIDTIREAYEKALADPNFRTTDDCGVVIKYLPDVPVYVVDGEESNMKLTHVEDVFLLEKLFQIRSASFQRNGSLTEMQDKVLVVFGGNSGIGKEIVRLSTHHGARAYPFSRSLNHVDVRKKADVARALRFVHDAEGSIDYVVNAAAMLSVQPLAHMTDEGIRDLVETNYLGAVNVSSAALPYLRDSGGQLLHFTSSSYTRGRPFYSLYSSTKAAVVNFVQAIAEEWEPFNVRVNCINPERTKTPMRERNFGYEPEETLLCPSQVARVSLQTLLSDFTGQVVDVRLTDASLYEMVR